MDSTTVAALLRWDAARWVSNASLQHIRGESLPFVGAGASKRADRSPAAEARVRADMEELFAAGKAVGERFDATTPCIAFTLAEAAKWASMLAAEGAL